MKIFKKILVLLIASMGLSGIAQPATGITGLEKKNEQEFFANAGKAILWIPACYVGLSLATKVLRGAWTAGKYLYVDIAKKVCAKILAIPGVGSVLAKTYGLTLGKLLTGASGLAKWLGWQIGPAVVIALLVTYIIYLRAKSQDASERDRYRIGRGNSLRRPLFW